MNKPDTKAVRGRLGLPTVFVGGRLAADSEHTVRWMAGALSQLCDYIDQLPDVLDDAAAAARDDYNKYLVKEAEDRVRAEIREVVAGVSGLQFPVHFILDFIDNGPKKPTAEDVIFGVFNGGKSFDQFSIAGALRVAGYLKDEEA